MRVNLILGFIIVVGLAAIGWGSVTVYDWMMAGLTSDEVLTAPRFVCLVLGIVGLSGSIPFALLGVRLANMRKQPPEDISGYIAMWWLLGNVALALPTFLVATSTHGGTVAARLCIAWLCFTFGAFPNGLSSASTTWANQVRRREWRDRLREMNEQSDARKQEHEAKMAVLRAKTEESKARSEELKRLHPKSDWYRAYTGRW